MEFGSRRRAEMRERDISPERTKVWIEPRPRAAAVEHKVPVVYYLSRSSGHLEHPHFMEVPVASGQGLYLRDVIRRLDSLRGKGMAGLYAWSSKRSYKNGFVWHDLSEDDFIYPAHGNEYILKGSEILNFNHSELLEIPESVGDDSDVTFCRKKETARGSFDLNEYKVYKNAPTFETAVKNADAWTQTEDRSENMQRRAIIKEREEEEENPITELGREEISPPSSTSSSETLAGLIKADGSIIPLTVTSNEDENVGNLSCRRIKTPAALMNLITCGSVSVRHKGFSLASHFKGRLPRASPSFAASELEDKEYFSGSLIDIKKKAGENGGEFSGLRKSSSCNAERGLKMELAEKEIEGVRARCIPRRPKAATVKKDWDQAIACSTNECKSIGNEST